MLDSPQKPRQAGKKHTANSTIVTSPRARHYRVAISRFRRRPLSAVVVPLFKKGATYLRLRSVPAPLLTGLVDLVTSIPLVPEREWTVTSIIFLCQLPAELALPSCHRIATSKSPSPTGLLLFSVWTAEICATTPCQTCLYAERVMHLVSYTSCIQWWQILIREETWRRYCCYCFHTAFLSARSLQLWPQAVASTYAG